MQDSQFLHLAKQFIESIATQIEEQDSDGVIEIDSGDGILNIYTPAGQYVINRQSAAKELWLASPISGPYHFSLKDKEWITKTNVKILELLSSELSRFVKITLN